jgi:hypothetical protein
VISHSVMNRGMSRYHIYHPEYIHQTDLHVPGQMLYRLIVGFKNARGLRIPASIHIKLGLGGQGIFFAPTGRKFNTLFSSTLRPMVYFSDDSEQYTSWKKVGNLCHLISCYQTTEKYVDVPQLQDTQSKDGFTTEALALAAQYEVSQTC